MMGTLLLASCLLATGGFRNQGGPGPASANQDLALQPRVGLSSKEDVLRMWGKPAGQRVEKNHTICTWNRGKVTCILTFNNELDLLVDRKILKN